MRCCYGSCRRKTSLKDASRRTVISAEGKGAPLLDGTVGCPIQKAKSRPDWSTMGHRSTNQSAFFVGACSYRGARRGWAGCRRGRWAGSKAERLRGGPSSRSRRARATAGQAVNEEHKPLVHRRACLSIRPNGPQTGPSFNSVASVMVALLTFSQSSFLPTWLSIFKPLSTNEEQLTRCIFSCFRGSPSWQHRASFSL